MYYTYKNFPELKEFDSKTKFKVVKYCLGKNKLFNYLYFPSIVVVAYVAGEILGKIFYVANISSNSTFGSVMYYAVLSLMILVYQLIITNTYVHSQVSKYVHEYKTDS